MLIYVNIQLQFNNSTLIKSGGGNGPCETRQPPQGKVLISAAAVLKDKREVDDYLWALLLLRRAFYLCAP